MTDDAPLFQAFPDRAGFPRYTIDLVSPEAPCGAGWLANCLIELGVAAWKPWNTDDRAHWIDLGASRYRYRLDGSPWSRVLPALIDGREHAFREGHAVRVHHAWPTTYPRSDRTIVFVRDPCDALHSAWHRQRRLGAIAQDLDFRAFCARPFYHYPLSWADYLLLFLRVWRIAVLEFGGIFVRFEDYRRDSIATLSRVVDDLALDASLAEIARGADASSLVRIRDAERLMLEAGVVDVALVRGAPPGDCAREQGDIAEILAARFGEIPVWLWEPPARAPASSSSACDGMVDAILDAIRVAGVSTSKSGWLADAVRRSVGDIVLVGERNPSVGIQRRGARSSSRHGA